MTSSAKSKQKSHVSVTRVAFNKAAMPPGTVTLSFKVTKPHSEALKRLVEAAVAYGTIPRARSLNSLTEDLKKAAQDMADEVLR